MSSAVSTLSGRIRAAALELGFDLVGIAPVRESDHGAFYRAWLEAGRHGHMDYLARPDAVERRLDPRKSGLDLRSAVVVAHNYYAAGDDRDAASPSRGVVARYARGRDYHKVIKRKLLKLLGQIEAEVGRELPATRAYVDTGPVLERELARRAGLGWFGRNTMLLHPRRGSYFFLGTLLLELDLEYDKPFEGDHCGTCNACVSACPTGALLGRDATGAPVMDATRCISYLTIEERGPIPRELRPLIGNRVFGCDICQEVCPFNVRFAREAEDPAYAARGPGEPPIGVEPLPAQDVSAETSGVGDSPHPGTDAPSLVRLLTMALHEEAWDSFSRGSAIRRARREGFARNLAVALGNWGSEVAVPPLTAALSDPSPLVRGHAAWALGRVASAEARQALYSALQEEREPFVLEELELALGDSRSIAK